MIQYDRVSGGIVDRWDVEVIVIAGGGGSLWHFFNQESDQRASIIEKEEMWELRNDRNQVG